ncbi:MAG: hypothetical protein JXK08_09575 [Flavobacteriaceae bacterium]|nr:hypothetical protein [Flavobacteriaceae bacterium]
MKKIRKELSEENINVPNRFKCCYFFESVGDCKRYLDNLNKSANQPIQHLYNKNIIKVEFLEKNTLKKFDNILITEFHDNFTSKDFYRQFKMFLLGKKTKNPLLEVVFQGSFKIIKNDIYI